MLCIELMLLTNTCMIKWIGMYDTADTKHSGSPAQVKKKRKYLQGWSHWRSHEVLLNLCMNMQPIKERKRVAKTKVKILISLEINNNAQTI